MYCWGCFVLWEVVNLTARPYKPHLASRRLSRVPRMPRAGADRIARGACSVYRLFWWLLVVRNPSA
eukprot:2384614-Prymnesium_polylepis.2